MGNDTEQKAPIQKSWKHYLAAFGAGFMLADTVPHYVSGVLGQDFPSFLGDPPGVGLAGPVVNVSFSLLYLFIGYVLLRASRVGFKDNKGMFALFMGIVSAGLLVAATVGANPNL